MVRMWDDKEPRTWIWDKVNLCPMKIKWQHYLKGKRKKRGGEKEEEKEEEEEGEEGGEEEGEEGG